VPIKTGVYLKIFLYNSDIIVFSIALIVSMFNIVEVKNISTAKDLKTKLNASGLLKIEFIIVLFSTDKNKYKKRKAKLVIAIIFNILKYMLLIEPILFLAFNNPE
jgi:hypothetical protein